MPIPVHLIKVEINENQLWVSVNEVEKAREELIKLIVDNHWSLLKFEVNHLTLEEVFTKVVRG